MHRLWIAICIVCGAALLTAALLVPAHSRAIEAKALEKAGERTPGLVEEGITFVQLEKVGPARMLLQAGQAENMTGLDKLVAAINQFNSEHPELAPWGGADPNIEKIELGAAAGRNPVPIVDLLMQRTIREKMLSFLRTSRRPGITHFLASRSITNTTHFPPATSASGQAFDASVIIASLLYQGDHLTPPLRDTIEFLAMKANKGDAEALDNLELAYVDLLSLGKRVDWLSLVELMKKVDSLKTVSRLAEAARSNEGQFAALFAAVVLSGEPGTVTEYMTRYPETGINDLSFAAKSGVGGTDMLLKQQHRIYYAGQVKTKLISYDPFGYWFYSLLPTVERTPKFALLLKYALLIMGSLCLARLVGVAAGTTQWLGLRLGADTVLALAIAFILGLMSEPFIGLPSQIHDLPLRFHIPVVAIGPGTIQNVTKLMNTTDRISLLPLIIFFVLQGMIYVWCLAKLNEIRRQPLEARMKLRLLENEDHLFDAGLYLGFVGTIIALILFSLGIAKFSLMSAYSSTSFGIIFVSVLKIFHVRPLRRKFIIESEVA